MERNQQNTVIRFIVIFTVFALGFMAVVGQILYIQIKERKQWLKIAEQQQAVQQEIPPMRGNIYDCNGNLLAGSLPRYELAMDTRVPALHNNNGKLFNQYIDSISEGLAAIFKDKSAAEYKRIITQAYKNKNGKLRLQKGSVSYTEMKAVKALPLFSRGQYTSGLMITPRHERIKPFGSLASRSIGSLQSLNGNPNCGLEKQYDELLQGKPGISQRTHVNGHTESIVIQDPEDGCDLITTIDANLQDLVESNLRQKVEEKGADWGCCILMDVKTGEIKAISNLERRKNGTYSEGRNYALQRCEPGSTFKTLSLVAALNEGKYCISDTFRTYSAGWVYKKKSHHRDAHRIDGFLTVRQGLAVSSNIVFAKLVTESFNHEAKRFVSRLDKMGVCQPFEFDIPGANDPLIRDPKDAVTISKMSYGYSVELSPLQIATFYNAIANNGRMIAPYMVREIQKDGQTIQTFSTHTINSSICNAEHLQDVKNALHDVVWDSHYGTAAGGNEDRRVQSPLVEIAGKTGTAQVRDPKTNQYQPLQHRVSFVGFFPYDDPQYTCICVIQSSPAIDYSAPGDCGSTVRKIAEKAMAYSGTRSSSELSMPYDSITKPGIKGGVQKRITEAAKGSGVQVTQTDSQWAKVNQQMQAVDVDVQPTSVPNVIGMGARDAVYAIEQTGMFAHIQGKGKVASQSVAPGSGIVKNGTIYLELR